MPFISESKSLPTSCSSLLLQINKFLYLKRFRFRSKYLHFTTVIQLLLYSDLRQILFFSSSWCNRPPRRSSATSRFVTKVWPQDRTAGHRSGSAHALTSRPPGKFASHSFCCPGSTDLTSRGGCYLQNSW